MKSFGKFIVFYLHILGAGLIVSYMGYPLCFILLNELDVHVLVVLIVMALYAFLAYKYFKIFFWINILPAIVAIMIAIDIDSNYTTFLITITVGSLILYPLILLFSKDKSK